MKDLTTKKIIYLYIFNNYCYIIKINTNQELIKSSSEFNIFNFIGD